MVCRLILSRSLMIAGAPAEVGVGRRHVGQALVVSLVIVVLDEGLDVGFEVAGQEVVFRKRPVTASPQTGR
jgi:hypothetical protein